MKNTERTRTSTFISRNGDRIFYRNWVPAESKPKGIILVVHGLNSHSAYYHDFALELNAVNYEVYALDLRGRGKSEGERYYIGDYHDIINDIDILVDIVKGAHPATPLFILGHSAGGVFASVYAAEHQAKLSGLISESFAFDLPAPGFALATVKFLSHIIPHTRMIKLNNADFSRDPSVVFKLNNDPLLENEKQPTKTMQQLLHAGSYLKRRMPDIELPLLILHGQADKATKPSGSQYFEAHAGTLDKRLKLYEGHYHDLLNDKYKGIVIRDIIEWLDERSK